MIQYYLSIFIAGFSLMTVEIVSSRIVAPIIGSSVFTWTSVIGITLLGLSIGSLVGGEIADRYLKAYGQKVLSFALFVAAFLVYLIVPLSRNVGFILDGSFSLPVLSILICGALFLLPALSIGALSPIIFKLYVGDIKNIGKKYGILSSVWSVGSIFGVFVTGFYFISVIGSSGIISLVSATLFLLFYFFSLKNLDRSSPHFKRHLAFLVILTLLLPLAFFFEKRPPLPASVLFQRETAYYDLRVVEYDLFPQYGKNRILFLDTDPNSIQTEKPSKEFYTDIYPAFSALSDTLKNIYVIGAGAYTLPINLRKYYPDSNITVSEIDPEVEKVGRAYFNVGNYDIKTVIGDARLDFSPARSTGEKYDLVFGDAYNSLISVPWYLMTKEFFSDVRGSLNQGGIFAINFIGTLQGPQSKVFGSVYNTMREVFPNDYIFAFGNTPEEIQNITIVGVKSDNHLSYDALAEKLDTIDPTYFLTRSLVDKSSLDSSALGKDMVLTDNFAPVDTMMTGLLSDYFPKYLPLYRKMLQ